MYIAYVQCLYCVLNTVTFRRHIQQFNSPHITITHIYSPLFTIIPMYSSVVIIKHYNKNSPSNFNGFTCFEDNIKILL